MPVIFPLASNQFLWNNWHDIFCKVTATAFALNVCSFRLLPSHSLDEALQGVCPCTDINQCAKRKSDGENCINIRMTAAINTPLLRSGQNKWKIRFFFSATHVQTHTCTFTLILFNSFDNWYEYSTNAN